MPDPTSTSQGGEYEKLGWEKAVAASSFETAKRALVEAWNNDGAGFVNTLPPIDFSEAELDHLVSAMLSARPAVAEDGWRTIDSAPKDGTWLLGWAERDSSPYRISWGRNHDGRLAWCTSFSSFVDGYITHWKPLDPPLSGAGMMARRPSIREEAFADLHVFACIEAIADGTFARTESGRDAMRKIGRICREQQQRHVATFDGASQ